MRKAPMSKFAGDSKTTARNLQILEEFIQAGLGHENRPSIADETESESALFPLWHTDQHMIPRRSNAYGYLNLFGPPPDDDSQMLDDREDRLRVFDEVFRPSIMAGLEAWRKEGGEQGRVAAQVVKAVKEASLVE